jgi:hypothetical protein
LTVRFLGAEGRIFDGEMLENAERGIFDGEILGKWTVGQGFDKLDSRYFLVGARCKFFISIYLYSFGHQGH